MRAASEQPALTRKQLRALYRRHYGAANQLALKIGVTRVTISKYLLGFPASAKVDSAVRERATELLAAEAEEKARKGRAA